MMHETGQYPDLELRLRSLAGRIGELKRKMARADTVVRIEMMGEVLQLEERERHLEVRLRKLNGQGNGARQRLRVEAEKIADDLAASIQDFILRVDRRRPTD